MAKENFSAVGEITVRLNAFAAQLEELKFFPDREKTVKMREDVLAFAGSELVAKNALRGHKEEIGTLLINILELEDTFK